MNSDETQRQTVAGDEEKALEGPFSFDVDIEVTETPEAARPDAGPDRSPDPDIPDSPAEAPRYWPDGLFEPVDAGDRPKEIERPEPRADRALPPASPLPIPVGEPVQVAPPPLELPGDAVVVEPSGTSPVPEQPTDAEEAEISEVPQLPSLPASQRLALPEARVEEDTAVESEESRQDLLGRVGKLVTGPVALIEKARTQRVEKRREQELSKTVEQREKERKKREERRARRRKKEEKKRRREAAKKHKDDEKRTSKLRKEGRRTKGKEEHREAAETPKRTLNREVSLRGIASSLPLVGRRLAAEKVEALDREAEAVAPEEKKKSSVLQKDLGASLRRRANRFRGTLQRNVIGLDIGAANIRAVRIKDGVPVEIHTHPLPEGIIVNGLLEEPDELVEELKRLWKLTGLRSKKVNFSLSNRMVTMRTKRLPAKHPDDIPQAVAMNAEELIYPMDPRESVMDYAEMSRSGPTSDLQITAADEDMAKAYARAVERAGLVAVSCELGPLAAARSVVIPRSPTRSHALINVGAEVSWMTVGSGPDVYFMRIIDIGGNDFTRAISEELGVSFLEAEGLKKRCGLGTSPVDPSLGEPTFTRCREAMRKVSDHLCQELAQTKRYWDEGRPERTIASWSLMGGGGRLVGLKDQIATFSGLQGPEILEPYPGFEGAEHLDLNTTALGLARGNTMSLLPDPSMKDTNVAMPGLRRRSKVSLRRSKREGRRLAAGKKGQHASPKTLAILGCVVVLGGGYYLRMGTEKEIDAQKTSLTAAKDAQQSAQKQPPAAPASTSPRYSNSAPATLLATKISSAPDSDALDAVQTALALVGAKKVAITTQGSTMTVGGTVESSAGVGQLVKVLRSSPYISQAQPQVKDTGAGVTTFSIVVTGS